MPGCLDDVRNSLVLQRRRRRGLLREERLTRLLTEIHTSVGGRLAGWAIKLTGLLDRLIEQDKVLLMGRQIQMLKVQLLRGWCRQARRTGGKPW